jgi:hypothetical protein
VSALPLPPAEISFFEEIKRDWEPLPRRVMRGQDVAVDISVIQRKLDEGRHAYRSERLPKEFNWDLDLRRAERFQAERIAWVERDMRARDDWRGFWQARIKDNSELVSKLLQDGVKFILVAHGAVAIAALSALMAANTDKHRVTLLCALFGAAIGLALVAAGQITIIETVSAFNNKVRESS